MEPATAPGFKSPEAKSRHTVWVALLAVLGVFIQIGIPMALYFLMVGSMLFGMRVAQPQGAVLWRGRLWYVEERIAPKMRLTSVDPRAGDAALEAEIDGRNAALLPDGDRLWIFSSEAVGWFRDRKITWEARGRWYRRHARAFLLDGAPALIEDGWTKHTLSTWRNGQWKTARSFSSKATGARSLQIVEREGAFHAFLEFNGTVHHLPRIPADDLDAEPWEPVGPATRKWSAFAWGDTLAVAGVDDSEPGMRLTVTALRDGEWKEVLRHSEWFAMEAGAVPVDDTTLAIILQEFPMSQTLTLADAGGARTTRRLSGFMSMIDFMIMFSILLFGLQVGLPLLLAAIYTRLAARDRTDDGYASLWRRALAHIVDGLIVWLPYLAASAFVSSRLLADWGNARRDILLFVGVAAAAIFATFALWLVFVYFEGRTGRTPGKRLLGIRVVGADTRAPCGFGRSFLRNILRIVDAFFDYEVGLVAAALTEKRQRVGDIVAKTIVIRDS